MIVGLVLILSFVAAAFAVELVVTTTFKPEECNESSKKSAAGDKLWMHYVGTIDESSASGNKGWVFDSSRSRNRPFDFVLGQGRVIRGWDEGLVGMCVGEQRTLIIPPEYGYGERGAGADIPGGATLKFEVECLDITDSSVPSKRPPANIFAIMDVNKDGKVSREEFNGWFQNIRGGAAPEGAFEREDADKDGVISWKEFQGPKGTTGPNGEEL